MGTKRICISDDNAFEGSWGKRGGGGGRDDELDRPLEHLYRISLLRFIERRTKILGCFSATITLNERC